MLAWFRRHAKILMVVLGSSAMAIFGLGPVFDTLASRGGGSDERKNEIVATWKGGDITRVDLDLMEMRHYQAQRFLRGVQQAAEKKKGDVVNSLALPISPLQDGEREMVDDQLISRYLMSEKAKEEGMMVSDAMVNDYVDLLSGSAGFSERDLQEINDVVNNKYCSVTSVREQLKAELLANQMQILCMTAVPIIPNPVESMELYGRTMEQVECEVLPIEVENYVGKVDGNPSAAETKKLYEEGKYEFPDPTGERPGFKIGRKINLQYLIADYETYIQNEMNKLSDEDVQKEYERLIEAKDELVLEPLPIDDGSIQINEPPPGDAEVTPPPTTEDGAKEADDSGDVTPPPTAQSETQPPAAKEAEAKTEEGKPEEGKPEAKTEESKPDTETPEKAKTEAAKSEAAKTEAAKTEAAKTEAAKAEAAKAEAAKAEAAKAEEAKSEEGKTEEAKSEGEGNQSLVVRESKFQFVSTAGQEGNPQESETAESKTDETKKPDTAGDAAQAPVEKSQAESQTANVKKPDPAEGSPATTETTAVPSTEAADAKQGDDVPASVDALMKDAADQVAADEAAEAMPVDRTPKPLKDVVEAVKRSMCEEAANKAMTKSLTQASVMVQDHFEKRLRWEFDGKKKEENEPAPLDHQALAKKYNLIAKETGLVDDLEIADDPIGQVRLVMNVMIQGRPTPQLVSVGQIVFNNFRSLGLYEAKTVNDVWTTKSSYLYWAAKKTDTRIPTLEEVQPQIIEFWRKQKALELAWAEAESIKNKVNDAGGQKLSELSFVSPERVIKTGAFTWFSSFGSTRYSTPIGVKAAGEDFMETAFSLPNFKAGVAKNEPKDVVYVVQAISEAKGAEEFGTDYLENQFFKFKRIPVEVQRVSQLYFQEFNLDWNQEFQEMMGLKLMDR